MGKNSKKADRKSNDQTETHIRIALAEIKESMEVLQITADSFHVSGMGGRVMNEEIEQTVFRISKISNLLLNRKMENRNG